MHLCETKQSLEILLLAPIVSLKMPTQPVIACSIAGSKRSFFLSVLYAEIYQKINKFKIRRKNNPFEKSCCAVPFVGFNLPYYGISYLFGLCSNTYSARNINAELF